MQTENNLSILLLTPALSEQIKCLPYNSNTSYTNVTQLIWQYFHENKEFAFVKIHDV